jgi:uncharacterized protein YlxP (DUF503 family)
MFIGILQFELLIRASTSLKDKRRVVRSLKDRLHREHLVSIAEIEALDHHKLAVMGVAIVSNTRANAEAVLDRVTGKLRRIPDAELGHLSREILSGDAAVADEPSEDGLPLWTEDERREGPPASQHSGDAA